MDPDLRAHINMPLVPINREGLYVIIAVPGVSILGCPCVLTYSFTNYSRLKRNAEEVRNYIAASSGGAKVSVDQQSGSLSKQPSAADVARMGDAFSSTASFKDHDAGNAISADLGRQRAGDAKGSDVSDAGLNANDAFPVLARQKAYGAVTGALLDGVGNGDAAAAVASATTVDAAVAYSIMAANVSRGTKRDSFAEGV
ncbi:hypothetical protein HPB49_023184 [Dermacentor silvarum]|uniref:Uncharacterized protein n=1 Tax=Dermacentor silvarum TaxID=543639 RepID=A0ACB8CC20_DERSI|nr:hypothetical protein HPB49_023184 [Dermacentor silvarum]